MQIPDNGAQQVAEEAQRFRSALPQLLRQYPGKWVVFRDGEVQGVFDDEFVAYRAGLARYGRRTPFVVDQVAEPEPPELVSAALDYYLP